MSERVRGFDAAEKHQSQIPALQLLVALGFTPLSQAEAVRLRGGRLRNVVLDDVLADQLLQINSFTHRGREYPFDLEDAHEAIRRLKPTPDRQKGLRGTNQDIYDTLVLGTTITKTIQGDSKSYSFRYVDWERPANNVYHVTAEVSVERTASIQTKRCDIVAYVNGIPFLVIENKRPTESLKEGRQPADRLSERRQHPAAVPLRAASHGDEPCRGALRHRGHAAAVLADVAGRGRPGRDHRSAGQSAAHGNRGGRGFFRATSPSLAPISKLWRPKVRARSRRRTAQSMRCAGRNACWT